MNQSYRIPTKQHRTEITILKSRFITTVGNAPTVEEAREFITNIKSEMPEANHHVYAFCIGYGNSIIEGMSDDGEPSSTAGSPSLAVLRGSDLGDIVIVTTRYFGGTKLGTGGLVRAYTQSVQEALLGLETQIKAYKQIIGIDLPYHLYDGVKRLIAEYRGKVQDETFAAEITLIIELLAQDVDEFSDKLIESTSGQLTIVRLSLIY